MNLDNTDYLIQHMPSWFAANDTTGVLRRFLSVFGAKLNDYDQLFETFSQKVAAGTAPEEWVVFWIYILFDWSWFPWWFTLGDKRRLYGNMATHLARRGTRAGIELWLRDFGIVARVHTRALPVDEIVLGETSFQITQPLRFVVEILETVDYAQDVQPLGEVVCGEGFFSDPRRPYTDREIFDLVEFMRPVSQVADIVWETGPWPTAEFQDQLYWSVIQW